MILGYLILILLVKSTFQIDCSLVPLQGIITISPIDNIHTGTTKISNNGVLKANISIGIEEKFRDKTPEIAAAIVNIEDYVMENKIYFQVIATYLVDHFQLEFKMENQTTTWKSVTLLYIVTANLNVKAGSFIVEDARLLENHNNSVITVLKQIVFNSKQNFKKRVFISSFLNGFKTASGNAFIKILSEGTIINPQGLIQIDIQITNTQPIQLLQFSFIVHTTVNSDVGVDAYSGSLADAQSATVDENINIFSGMTGFNGTLNTQRNQQTIRLLQETNQSIIQLVRTNTTSLFQSTFNIQGLEFRNLQNLLSQPILLGPEQALQCLSLQECIAEGGIQIYQNQQVRCIICSDNKLYNFDRNICLCINGLYQNNQRKCVTQSELCQQNEIFVSGLCFKIIIITSPEICTFNQSYNPITKQCQCNQYYISTVVNGTLKCSDPCTKIGQILNFLTGKCQCLRGVRNAEGNCNPCPSNSQQYNTSTKKCECIPSLKRVQGICIKCSSNSNYDELLQLCKCNEGYTGNGNICRLVTTGITVLN